MDDFADKVDLDETDKLRRGARETEELLQDSALRLGKRRLGSFFPLVGSVTTFAFAEPEWSTEETAAHAIAGEVGIGPVDLDLVWEVLFEPSKAY